MKKVKQVWYDDSFKPTEQNYRTGLVLELEDGSLLQANSTDMIEPFSIVKAEDLSSEPPTEQSERELAPRATP